MLRTGNKLAAVLTLLGDGAKGWVAVELARYFAPQYGLADPEIAMVALAVFVGHLWPIFLKFHGGKGVATALGVLLAFHPLLALAALGTWLLIAFTTRISSLAALIAALSAPVYGMFLLDGGVYLGTTFILSLLLVRRHKQNILNLLAGKEGKIGQDKKSS